MRRRVPTKLSRPAIIYGAETLAISDNKMGLRYRRDENAKVDVRSDTQRQDLERTHPRNNECGAGFQKDHRAKIEPIRACDEERWRTHVY